MTRKTEQIQFFYEHTSGKEKDHEILGWESEEAQNLRFQVFADAVGLENKSLLDVGCGLGNLLTYLDKRGVCFDYTGVDILERMIRQATRRCTSGTFIRGDVFTENIFRDNSFDAVFASGIFNLNLGNNETFFPDAVKKLYGIAREYLAFNLLHTHSPDRDDRFYYYHPDEVREWLTSQLIGNPDIRIISEYLPNDFTVVIRK